MTTQSMTSEARQTGRPLDFTPYAINTLWLDPVPKPRTLLVAYQHLDDESFGDRSR